MPNSSPPFAWNYDRIESIADGLIHAVGVLLGLAGAIVLVIVAAHSARVAQVLPITIYAVGLLTMLGLSAAYNLWPISPAKRFLRRFDHSAIYLLIAATYTPFIAHMEFGPASAALMTGVWATAFLGIAVKLLAPGRLDRLSVVLYLILGWSGVAFYEPVIAALPAVCLWFLAAGGVLYSAGVVFHAWQSLRFHTAIWHGFVLVAASCHYSAVVASLVVARA